MAKEKLIEKYPTRIHTIVDENGNLKQEAIDILKGPDTSKPSTPQKTEVGIPDNVVTI
ncbi:MAG: hypothetical protein HC803_01990, partial [Saprospiraceae bacterium]|nr:hypothetical protein [Saprospiraceae bacterium]